MTYPPQGNPPIEGEFSTWTLVWVKNTNTDWTAGAVFELQRILANEVKDRLTAITDLGQHVVVKLSDGTPITVITTDKTNVWQGNESASPNRYSAYATLAGGVFTLHIFKDGTEIQTTNLTTLFPGWTAGFVYVAFSPSGKYLALLATGPDFALFKGA